MRGVHLFRIWHPRDRVALRPSVMRTSEIGPFWISLLCPTELPILRYSKHLPSRIGQTGALVPDRAVQFQRPTPYDGGIGQPRYLVIFENVS